MHKRERPLFDGLIMDSSHFTVKDAENAMDYMSKKYKLPVSAYLNGRFIVKSSQQQQKSQQKEA